MINKVVYLVKSELHIYPPCLAQIRIMKKLGVDIEVWYGSCNKKTVDLLLSENIICKNLEEKRGMFSGKLDTLNNWFNFGRTVKKYINSCNKSNTLFWFGSTETAIPLLGKLKNVQYALTSLELLDDNPIKKNLFGILSKRARFIICCEITRAFIMRYWYKLERVPYVMPNKPYGFYMEKRRKPSIEETAKVINIIKDKKFIIYQGILKSKDYMMEMAKAIKTSNTGYYFVLMGFDPENIYPEIKSKYEKTIFISNIPSPYHLEITSYAHIGFVFYDDRNTLNRAFCAPNKIYEYSGLGIPAIGNKVPGLINTINAFKTGVCVEIKEENLVKAIEEIENNYLIYVENSLKFYKETDNVSLMKKILTENKILWRND